MKLAELARLSLEPGLLRDEAGRPESAGSCLHGCLLVVVLLKRFGQGAARVRGGAQGQGARDVHGHWRGHYWVEVYCASGAVFVVDITADQFGYEKVVVVPLAQSAERYRPGPQPEVTEAFADMVTEFGCWDLIGREALLE